MTSDALRFGILGAANIAPGALIAPSRDVARVEVIGVAARDPQRARWFADTHGLPTVWDTYDDLLSDPAINAVYIPLPPGLHHEWVIKALEAGKHVLCEKPFSATRLEAVEMVATAERTGMRLGEAFHWRYHPLIARVRELLDSGALGKVVRVETEFSASITDTAGLRYNLSLAGGGFMDLGVYPLQWSRFVTGEEPQILSAVAVEHPASPGIDVAMDVEVAYPSGVTGHIRSAMEGDFVAFLKVIGTDGVLHVHNPVGPHHGHSLTLTLADGTETTESMQGEDNRPTYYYQLTAFAAHVLDGAPFATSGDDIINTMAAVEAVYASAGLPSRRV